MSERKPAIVAKTFSATIYRIWMMRHVDVPEDVAASLIRAFKKRGGASGASAETRTNSKYIPVIAIVNGRSARVSLVPAGGGRYRVQINTAQRKAARADVGEMLRVELRLDLASRELPVPSDLRAALKGYPKARKAFEALTTGHRRHFIEWFDSAKAPETRIRRLGRAIDVLLERAILGSSRSKRSAPRPARKRGQ